MTEKYLLFDLEDEKIKKLGEVISNSTCKKIVNLLAEKELSESDIARELSLPLNTIEYNLKKLLDAGIIEKSRNFFWSRKGKKIDMYKVANKLIVIAPKRSNVYSKLKGIVPIVLISGILTGFVAWYYKVNSFTGVEKIEEIGKSAVSMPQVQEAIAGAGKSAGTLGFNPWAWFLIGSLTALIAFLLWNWKKL